MSVGRRLPRGISRLVLRSVLLLHLLRNLKDLHEQRLQILRFAILRADGGLVLAAERLIVSAISLRSYRVFDGINHRLRRFLGLSLALIHIDNLEQTALLAAGLPLLRLDFVQAVYRALSFEEEVLRRRSL